MKKSLNLLSSSLLTLGVTISSFSLQADEGMWQPHQLPEIAEKLKNAGLELDPNDLTELTAFPMGAIVSLGGCTASFVSSMGLVATNHHCVYGSVQYNSTEDNNILKNGFLAESFDQELPAAPGSRIYVTEEINEVTEQVNQGLNADMTGSERFDRVDLNSKKLVADCEQDDRYRCSVVNFHGGLQYFLFKQFTIRDVRLVHAPAASIGKFGGDIDNWMWPRHTGDYGFYRAYVNKEGQPADFSKDNVPYQPKHHLKVNAKGVDEGDYIMVLGYPGRTNRYRTSTEVENTFTWTYPHAKAYREEYIDIIKANSKPHSDKRIKYESTLASLANYAKNYGSMVESYNKGNMLERKRQLETDLASWIKQDKKRKKLYGNTLKGLDQLIRKEMANQERELVLSYLERTSMMSTAYALHKLAMEKQKPDMERESGFQERDLTRFEQRMKSIDRRFDPEIDKAVVKHFIKRYIAIPKAQQVASLNQFFGLENEVDEQKLSEKLDEIFAKTQLGDESVRLAWMTKSVDEFNQSRDPFIQLAVATYHDRKAIEEAGENLSGEIQAFRPRYMEALIAYFKDKNLPVYADANSTLRITYGNVKGYSPRDGLYATPFTRLEGILEKDSGVEPFDSPQKQLDLIKQKKYGQYVKQDLASVPVNYLGTLDITGGNSGSPTLNGRGEFVGLVFDGVYESIIGDWDYDDHLNRSITVDSRYILWVMEHVDGATNLIEEMDVIR